MDKKVIRSFLFKLLQPYLKSISLVFVISIFSSVLILFVPLLLNEIINIFKNNSYFDGKVIALLIALLFGQLTLSFFYDYLISNVGERVTVLYREKLFGKIIYYNTPVGITNSEISSRMNDDIKSLKNVVVNKPLQLLKNLLVIIGTLSLLIYINYLVTIIILITIIFIGILSSGSLKKIRTISEEIQNLHTNLMSLINESLSNLVMIKTFNAEAIVLNKFNDQTTSMLQLIKNRNFKLAIIKPVTNFTLYILLIISLSISFILFNDMSSENIVSYLFYSFALAASITQLSGNISEINKDLGTVNRIINLDINLKKDGGSIDIDSKSGIEVRFENVTFSYNSKENVLNNVSFTIKKNRVNALVGMSGSGKSTVIDLLLKNIEPQKGVIYVNDIPIKDIKKESLYLNMGVVFQQPYLFNDTIYNNIKLAKPEASDEEVLNCLIKVNLQDNISIFDKGYNHVVGEDYKNISRGQAQRVSIARMLLKKPQIMILDEATASLDKENEHIIKQSLSDLKSSSTTLIVSHNQELLDKYVDHYIYINHGQVSESTNETLVTN